MQTFQELSLSPLLMRAIQEMGYETPSPIQAQALPILLAEPTDFIGLAATGTGKTAAFSIPLLERINPADPAVQALILCPTRELALQVAGQIDLLGKYLGIKALPVYGGSSYGDQIRGLNRGATIVVGTPGRVVDHLERGTLRLDGVRTMILDEADEMISMGFKEDLEAILSQTSRESARIWLFSATMGEDVREVAETYLSEPLQVQVNRAEMLPETIEQLYFRTHESDKPEILCKLIDAADDFYGLIFCQTKSLVVDLTQYLKSRGYLVDCLHGDMEQDARERTMKIFRDRRVKVLVCTDVASRGLDVKDITHVINYSIPRELDNYVHRIGRTARSGKRGVAMSLVTPSHRGLIPRIERMTKSRMQEGRIPTRRELAAKKVASALARFQDQPLHGRVLEVMDESWKQALASMSAEEVAARFLAAMHPEVFAERGAAATAPKREAPVKPLAKAVVEPVGAAPVAEPVLAPAVAPVVVALQISPEMTPLTPLTSGAETPNEVAEPAPVETPVEAEPMRLKSPLTLADFGELDQPVRKKKAKAKAAAPVPAKIEIAAAPVEPARDLAPAVKPLVAPLAVPVKAQRPAKGGKFAKTGKFSEPGSRKPRWDKKPAWGSFEDRKPFARKGGFKRKGSVGRQDSAWGAGAGDAGLGRAPQERSFSGGWKKRPGSVKGPGGAGRGWSKGGRPDRFRRAP